MHHTYAAHTLYFARRQVYIVAPQVLFSRHVPHHSQEASASPKELQCTLLSQISIYVFTLRPYWDLGVPNPNYDKQTQLKMQASVLAGPKLCLCYNPEY